MTSCGARSDLDIPDAIDATTDVVEEATQAPQDASVDVAPALSCPVAPWSPLTALNWGMCPPTCGAPLDVTIGSITVSSPTCNLDLVLQPGERGLIQRPCCNDHYCQWPTAFDAGGLQTYAEFFATPQLAFYGAIGDNVISVCAGTTYVAADGCTWATAQTITGPSPAACAVGSGPFTFSYEEQPVAGTNCHTACTATAPVIVTSQ